MQENKKEDYIKSFNLYKQRNTQDAYLLANSLYNSGFDNDNTLLEDSLMNSFHFSDIEYKFDKSENQILNASRKLIPQTSLINKIPQKKEFLYQPTIQSFDEIMENIDQDKSISGINSVIDYGFMNSIIYQ